MSSDNALVIIGNKVWDISASDAWDTTEEGELRAYVADRRPFHVGHCHDCAVGFVNRHDEPFDDAYSEYGVWLEVEE